MVKGVAAINTELGIAVLLGDNSTWPLPWVWLFRDCAPFQLVINIFVDERGLGPYEERSTRRVSVGMREVPSAMVNCRNSDMDSEPTGR